MSTVYPETYDGGHNLTRGHKVVKRPGETDLATYQREVADDLGGVLADLGSILTALQTLTDKMDLDAGITDTDYRATLDGVIASLSTSLKTLAG